MNFENKVMIVTGSGNIGGVGQATAKLFVARGGKVAMLDANEVVKDTAQQLGENAVGFVCNVASEEEVQATIAKVLETFGTIDYLVNNAAVLGYTKVSDTPLEEWNRIMGVNITGPFLMAKHAIPTMEAKKNGVVINVGSAQSFMSQKQVAPYVTSKTAILGLTRSIAVDYAPYIRSMSVCPSTIDTPMLRWAMEQSPDPQEIYDECVDMDLMKRVAQPNEIGELILFLCSDAAANMTGQAIRSDGGIGLLIEGSKR